MNFEPRGLNGSQRGSAIRGVRFDRARMINPLSANSTVDHGAERNPTSTSDLPAEQLGSIQLPPSLCKNSGERNFR